jgi:hypothetical protein
MSDLASDLACRKATLVESFHQGLVDFGVLSAVFAARKDFEIAGPVVVFLAILVMDVPWWEPSDEAMLVAADIAVRSDFP